MAANTSFADFPRLAALHAGDRFLPRQLTFRGNRLVFSWGITLLALLASALIVVFNADVSALIPLYAIGVFLSFTLSQAGMVVRWRKISKLKPGQVIKTQGSELTYDRHWWAKMALNGIGATASFVVMIIFAVTKFPYGAWVVVVLIPALVIFFFRIHHHYKRVARELSLQGKDQKVCDHPLKTILLVEVPYGKLHQSDARAVGGRAYRHFTGEGRTSSTEVARASARCAAAGHPRIALPQPDPADGQIYQRISTASAGCIRARDHEPDRI
jgi:hypothetical protein